MSSRGINVPSNVSAIPFHQFFHDHLYAPASRYVPGALWLLFLVLPGNSFFSSVPGPLSCLQQSQHFLSLLLRVTVQVCFFCHTIHPAQTIQVMDLNFLKGNKMLILWRCFLKRRAITLGDELCHLVVGILAPFSLLVAIASPSGVHNVSVHANHCALSQVGYFYPLGYMLHTAASRSL